MGPIFLLVLPVIIKDFFIDEVVLTPQTLLSYCFQKEHLKKFQYKVCTVPCLLQLLLLSFRVIFSCRLVNISRSRGAVGKLFICSVILIKSELPSFWQNEICLLVWALHLDFYYFFYPTGLCPTFSYLVL